MPKYRAYIKQTEWLEVDFDAEDENDAWNTAAEVFGSTDARSVDLDVQVTDVEELAD